jgi:putative ABC transport system substrate-binding protein
MRWREFITLIGGAIIGRPLRPRAQQAPKPVIGFLTFTAPQLKSPSADAFRNGLAEAGYIEGQNIVIEYRWAEGRYIRMPALAADLVQLPSEDLPQYMQRRPRPRQFRLSSRPPPMR